VQREVWRCADELVGRGLVTVRASSKTVGVNPCCLGWRLIRKVSSLSGQRRWRSRC